MFNKMVLEMMEVTTKRSLSRTKYSVMLLLLFISMAIPSVVVFAQEKKVYELSGRVLDKNTRKPIQFVTVSVPQVGVWTRSTNTGQFSMKKLPAGKLSVRAQILGYVAQEVEVLLTKDDRLDILLDADDLKLSEVEITAKKVEDKLATSFVIDRKALDHLQMLNVTDVTSLLPGGKTISPTHLATTAAQRFEINGYSGERGNATFGVAVEMDGVRLSNDGSRDGAGIDTKNIATSNIESIEVVTGVPSVEYGDMTNGFVKIETRKGVSPFILETSTRPNTKQVALSKGIGLGENAGVLNLNVDYLKSISNLASPYTSYNRNSLSLNYNNTFNKSRQKPIVLNVGVSGNLGGYSSESDPDLFANTYTKHKDNVLKANLLAKWLLKLPWITSLEATSSINFNDKISEVSVNKSATSSVASIRTREEGYNVGELYADNPNAGLVLIPKGFWYEVNYNDSKLLNYNAKLKGNLFKKIGNLKNSLMLGAELSASGNTGKGNYYKDLSTAPTWREYAFKDEPFTRNYAFFAEDVLTIPVQKSNLQLMGGLRSEFTSISGSEYGNVASWSPRFNAKYTFWRQQDQLLSALDVKIGWGKTVKMPGFNALYAVPTWRDVLTFSPGTTASGDTYYGYYTVPRTRLYNPDLKWQSNTRREIAIGAKVAGHRIFVNVSQDKTKNPYVALNNFEQFFYKFTSQANLEASTIPAANRIYTVDKYSGVVTVTDKTGAKQPERLSYTDMYGFNASTSYTNGSEVNRTRVNWIIDFAKIDVLKTTVRLDGNYYYYKGLEETVSAYMPNATQMMANGKPYAYIGFFTGGANTSNGDITKSVDMNLTVSTHIPALRLIISGKIEGSFYNYGQRLSQKSNGGNRGFVLADRDKYDPSATATDIYAGNQYIGVYPDYYVSLDNLQEQIPFADKFLWAKTNDVALYNELAKMVIKTNYDYIFNASKLSTYFGANLAVTKEFGKYASVSFFANNFAINMGKVHSSMANTESSLFNSSAIPMFNYGASLRLKF